MPLVAGRLCVDSPRERCGVLWRCRKTLHVDLGLWFSRCLLLSLPAMSDYVELGDAALSAAEMRRRMASCIAKSAGKRRITHVRG